MVLRQDKGTERKVTGGAGKTRGRRALTYRSIEALRPEVAPYRVPDTKCSGLAIRVAPSGLLSWDLAFRVKGLNDGKRVFRRVSLGRFPDVGLDAARARAGELTRAARAGLDLLKSEQAAQAEASSRITVAQLIDLYIKRRVAGPLKSARGIEHRLRRALVPILNRYADEIRRRDMRELLDEVADRNLKREADKRRNTIGTMFKWAMSQDFVTIDPTAGLASYGDETSSDRVLSGEEKGSCGFGWHPRACQRIAGMYFVLNWRSAQDAARSQEWSPMRSTPQNGSGPSRQSVPRMEKRASLRWWVSPAIYWRPS
jgi:Arm DNA-binding domain